MEINFRSPDLIKLREALRSYARRGLPHAARNALNGIAFEARERWQQEMAEAMTLRNTWTTRSVRVVKARGTNVRRMEAVLGSLAAYMATQEEGGQLRKKHKHGVSVPTSVASGEGRGAQPRRKVVRRPNRLPNIHLATRIGSSRKQRNVVAIRMAIAAGRKFIFLELERHQGIFRLSGGKRRPRVDMLWDLSRPSVRIPPTHTLGKTMGAMPQRATIHLERALLAQLARARVPGYVARELPGTPRFVG